MIFLLSDFYSKKIYKIVFTKTIVISFKLLTYIIIQMSCKFFIFVYQKPLKLYIIIFFDFFNKTFVIINLSIISKIQKIRFDNNFISSNLFFFLIKLCLLPINVKIKIPLFLSLLLICCKIVENLILLS